MEQLNRILVIFDQSQSEQIALLRAIELSRTTGARIDLVSTLHATINFMNGEILVETEELLRQRLIENRQAEINTLLKELATDEIEIHSHIVWTPVAHEEIIKLCDQNHYDLLIKKASRHFRLEGFIHTPFDWHLLRECPCPVLIVTEQSWSKGSTILAAIDAISDQSEHKSLNKRIIEHATYMGDVLDDVVHVATACPPLPIMIDMEYAPIDPDIYLNKMRQTAMKQSKQAMEDSFLATDNMHILTGQPEIVLADLAEQLDSRMIVLGTVARTGIQGYLIGNTAEQILCDMQCDILVIKPEVNS